MSDSARTYRVYSSDASTLLLETLREWEAWKYAKRANGVVTDQRGLVLPPRPRVRRRERASEAHEKAVAVVA